jgi:hypothetical protein
VQTTAKAVRTALIFVAQVWAIAAGAKDVVKPGKWEISTTNPGVTKLLPGMKLGPGQSIGPEGIITVITKCASVTNPPFPPKPPPVGLKIACKMEKSDLVSTPSGGPS